MKGFMAKLLRFIITWTCYFAGYVGMVLMLGALVGALAYLFLGFFIQSDLGAWERFHEGAWLGFRWIGLWAGGLALILCAMQGYRTKHSVSKNP
jgi:hypothetical protein